MASRWGKRTTATGQEKSGTLRPFNGGRAMLQKQVDINIPLHKCFQYSRMNDIPNTETRRQQNNKTAACRISHWRQHFHSNSLLDHTPQAFHQWQLAFINALHSVA